MVNITNNFNFNTPMPLAQKVIRPPLTQGSVFGSGFGDLFGGLAKALQGLADMLGGSPRPEDGGFDNGFPILDTPSSKPISGEARIWGDPHFIGADGGKYDVQGEAGKTYNLLSDKGFQMNGTFEKWHSEGATVVGKVGITAGSNYIQVDKTGNTIINGRALKDGERVQLRDGGYAERKGDEITVKKGEWEVNFQTRGDHINMDIKTDNAVSDGVAPHGLIGQTFDADDDARNGDKGTGAQGGGAIERADGSMSRSGDKKAVESYEVSALWDTTFHTHNSDFAQQSVYHDQARETMQFAMMMGFSSLMNNLFANNNLFSGIATPNYRF